MSWRRDVSCPYSFSSLSNSVFASAICRDKVFQGRFSINLNQIKPQKWINGKKKGSESTGLQGPEESIAGEYQRRKLGRRWLEHKKEGAIGRGREDEKNSEWVRSRNDKIIDLLSIFADLVNSKHSEILSNHLIKQIARNLKPSAKVEITTALWPLHESLEIFRNGDYFGMTQRFRNTWVFSK
jgi:hypothetical protein